MISKTHLITIGAAALLLPLAAACGDSTDPDPDATTPTVLSSDPDAAGRAPDGTELGAGNIGGMTLIPGVYKWGTGLLIPTSITLTGSSTAVWIFQVAQDLTVSSATKILLAGGAFPPERSIQGSRT